MRVVQLKLFIGGIALPGLVRLLPQCIMRERPTQKGEAGSGAPSLRCGWGKESTVVCLIEKSHISQI